MARSVPWRRSASDAVSWRQDQSQNAIIYILRETGPTGFLLKEEGESKKYKVFLGDPHSCTCQVFTKERDLCKHICWILLKKFRIPRQNPLSFQLGLVEREINEILQGLKMKEQQPSRRAVELAKKAANKQKDAPSDGREMLQQKEITEDDVCPICQDELLEKREPVTYCRYGCGKSTHIRCMKVWAEHQKSTGEVVIRCPLCREDYGQLEDLQAEYRTATLQKTRQERREDIHMGVACKSCNQSPILGKCYRCSQCFDYCICHACFSNNLHQEHSFLFRQKPTQRWRPAQRGSGTALPQAIVQDLLNREISEGDYDILLQLDNDAANKPSNIPEKVIKSFPVETIRQGSAMLTPGTQCRVCLRGYEIGQVVRRLPCRHKYHLPCIDQWLLHEHPTCPVDGTVVWNPLTSETSRQQRKKHPQSLAGQNATNQVPALEIPGIGVTVHQGSLDRETIRQGSHRQNVERSEEDQGLAANFALTGLGISSSGNRPIVSRNLTTSNRTQSSGRRQGSHTRPPRGSPASTRHQGRIADPRISSSDDSQIGNPLTVTGSRGVVDRQAVQVDHRRYDNEESDLLQNRTEGDQVNNPRQTASVHRNTHTTYNSSRTLPDQSSNNPCAITDGAEDSLTHQMNSLVVGITQMSSSARPSAGPGWKPPPTTLANERSHISSIPLPREAAMTPIGNRQQSNSAPSVANRKPPLPEGGSPGLVRGAGERGRRGSRSDIHRRGSRSSSASRRTRSRERLHGESPNKLETLENMFLGSPTGNLVISHTTSSPGSPNNRGHRSNHPRPRTKTSHSSGEGSSQSTEDPCVDMALTGNRLTAHTP